MQHIREVKEAARGHWREILLSLAPSLTEAVEAAPRHVPCPVHGGTNGFRLFPHWEDTGAAICNTCGGFNDGFALLQFVNGWQFSETVNKVGDFLNMKSHSYRVLETNTEGSKYTGVISYLGMTKLKNGRECFILKFKNGELHWGTDLMRACSLAGLAVGDTAELTLVARQQAVNAKGKRFSKVLWTAKRLLSEEEKLKKEEEERKKFEARRISLVKLWKKSEPIILALETPVSKYFASRGICEREFSPLKLSDLRFVQNMDYVEEGKHFSFPGFFGVVRDCSGTAVTLHRTYLTKQGTKAPVSAPKKLMPVPDPSFCINGCSIHLGDEPRELLCLAEGIETALSVLTATGYPCWSTINAHGLETIEIPETVKIVCIFADKDKSGTGQAAAKKLKERLKAKGIKAFIFLPEEDLAENSKGVDWNDHLRTFGPDSFPI